MDFEMLKAAIKEIAGNHNLSEKVVVASLESAIEKAYLREIKTPDAEVKVGLDMETGLITVAQLKLVMKDEEIQDDALEIDYDAAKEDADLFLENLEEEKEDALKERGEALAQKKSPKRESRLKDLDWRLLEVENLSRLVKEARENVRFGGKYPMYCDIESLSKMIVRMVGSGFRQAIAEAEREALYDVYKDHIGEMETGIVDKADERTVVVRLRHGVTEMSRRELIGEETFKPGEQIKVYIEEVRPVNEPGKPQRGPQVQATRASEGFLRRLFEEEIREVYDGTVLIKAIAREAGVRSKVAVLSTDDAIDATGACIGAQGSRIQKVVDQLGHNLREKEKIDIISYSDYLPLFAAESLRPAEVLGVHISEEEPEEGKHRVCHLIVDESQKKRAYGRKRSNQRLAGKLTGLHMEILTPEEAEDLGIEWTPTEELRKLAQEDKLRREMAEYARKNREEAEKKAQRLKEAEASLPAEKEVEAPRPVEETPLVEEVPSGETLPGEHVGEEIPVAPLPKEPERSWRKEDEALKAYHEELRSLVICYQDIVELMVQQMDGRSFTDQAFYELTAQCHRAAWNTYQGTPKFERKKNVIRYTGYGCRCKSWGHSDEWELQQDTKDILKGAAFFENGVFRLYPMGFQELLGYSGSYDNEHNFPTCVKLVQLKMFKNGRVDFKFSTEAYAEKFVRDYLGEVC